MALKYQQKLSDLRNIDAQNGTLRWIGIRPEPRHDLQTPDHIECIAGYGLAGDHRAAKSGSKRQVTLFQYEYLSVLSELLPGQTVQAELIRRNLMVSSINLNSLKAHRFRIGSVEFEGTGYCHPCSRMEENLGDGGYNAMRGHGGITARILTSGTISIGDTLHRIQTTH